jgi:type II secretory pathway pseudopilin PulG
MSGNCELQIADCGLAYSQRRPNELRADSPIRNSKSAIRNLRPALTLVELLITMVIMAIIAAAIMGTASAALESARRSRTRSTIHKIHSLVMERLESYYTRRADVNPQLTLAIDQAVAAAGNNRNQALLNRGHMLADLRLLAIRELMMFEMPDRWTDFVQNPGTPTSPVRQATVLNFISPNGPALAQYYLRRWQSAKPTAQYQGAECLYMVVMATTGDGEARTLFTKQEIGDVDADGMQEFLDGWGQPISWLRWPAGFISDMQPIVDAAGNRPGDTDHDPFDAYHRDEAGVVHDVPPGASSFIKAEITSLDQRNRGSDLRRATAYRLVPLIYSAGPDGDSGIFAGGDEISNPPTLLDPYRLVQQPNSSNKYLVGTVLDNGVKDNIHNHLLEK